jgi:hypothetical protein
MFLSTIRMNTVSEADLVVSLGILKEREDTARCRIEIRIPRIAFSTFCQFTGGLCDGDHLVEMHEIVECQNNTDSFVGKSST